MLPTMIQLVHFSSNEKEASGIKDEQAQLTMLIEFNTHLRGRDRASQQVDRSSSPHFHPVYDPNQIAWSR